MLLKHCKLQMKGTLWTPLAPFMLYFDNGRRKLHPFFDLPLLLQRKNFKIGITEILLAGLRPWLSVQNFGSRNYFFYAARSHFQTRQRFQCFPLLAAVESGGCAATLALNARRAGQ